MLGFLSFVIYSFQHEMITIGKMSFFIPLFKRIYFHILSAYVEKGWISDGF